MTQRHRIIPLAFILPLLIFSTASTVASALPMASEQKCNAREASAGLKKRSVEVRKRCQDTELIDVAERFAEREKPLTEEPVITVAPPPTTKRTTLVSGCLDSLAGEPALEGCLAQEEAFCPGEDSTWVVPKTTDTAAPEQGPTYGMRQCTQSGAVPGPAADEGEARPAVSIDDVAELFAPEPRILSDDEGRGVRHAETNFYTDGEVRTLRTTMNGEEVELRLTPIQYIWDYGDGSAPHVTSVPGGTQPGFDVPTATSHVYEETGAYPVTLTTVYVGEVRYEGGDWERIDGQITRTAAPETADIWTTSTRNVAGDCAADPGAWGCTGPVENP